MRHPGQIRIRQRALTALARQAYRKPVNDTEVEELLSAYQKGRNRGDFESGVRMGLQTILAHPEFVFRFEPTPAILAARFPGTS